MRLFLMFLLMSNFSWAQTNTNVSQGSSANNLNCGNVHVTCKPTVIYSTKKQQELIKKLQAENAQLKSQLAHDLAVYRHVIIKIDNRIEKIKQENPGKNAISLVGGVSSTGLNVSGTSTTFTAKTVYQRDFGLMYQRDFGFVRGSAEVTMDGVVLLGIGLRF